jgi:copper chaperone NosL
MRTFLALTLLAAGCGAESTGPVALALGEDGCDLCRMIISEQRFAVEARFSPSKVEKYDDVGCLVERLAKGGTPSQMWVADHGTGAWVDVRTAVFVVAKDVKTPMASGIVGFARREDADAFARKHAGRLATFDEAREAKRPK